MDIDREKEGKCLTVTVPCYNSESYLERCVESLLKERDGLEIILVDDGSTDRTGQLADQYARAYPDVVRVVHQGKRRARFRCQRRADARKRNLFQGRGIRTTGWMRPAFIKLMQRPAVSGAGQRRKNAPTWLSAIMYTIIWKREKRKQSATEIFFPSKKSAGGTKSAVFRRNSSSLSCMR